VGNCLSINYNASKIDLALLPEKMLDYALEVLMDQAHLIVAYAQMNVHVDTGALRDSIRVERGGQDERWRQIRIRAGGYITNPKTGRIVDYAGVVEARYPYLRPAYDEVADQIVEMLKTKVVEKMNSSASGVVPL
jgi:hypothetical protein